MTLPRARDPKSPKSAPYTRLPARLVGWGAGLGAGRSGGLLWGDLPRSERR